MKLEQMPHSFSVAKFPQLPVLGKNLAPYFLSVTEEEISLVCPTQHMPPNPSHQEDNWACLKICGVLEFSMVGVLAKISSLLAGENISIFAISTYNTDYILCKSHQITQAISLLKNQGYTVI